jgi:hypothetical protein
VGLAGTEQIYRLNSPYDPDYSGSGHQPYGYDQISPLYRKVVVSNVKLTCITQDPSEDGLAAAWMLQASNGTFALAGSAADYLAEKPMVLFHEVSNTGSQRRQSTQNVPLHVLEGITKAQYDNQLSAYGSTVGAVPTSVPYLRVAAVSLRGTGGATLIARVSMVMDCQFYERIVQAVS